MLQAGHDGVALARVSEYLNLAFTMAFTYQ